MPGKITEHVSVFMCRNNVVVGESLSTVMLVDAYDYLSFFFISKQAFSHASPCFLTAVVSVTATIKILEQPAHLHL